MEACTFEGTLWTRSHDCPENRISQRTVLGEFHQIGSGDSLSHSDQSLLMFGMHCDEVVTDADRQLIRGEMLHVQMNDVAIFLQMHLYSRESTDVRRRREKELLFSPLKIDTN